LGALRGTARRRPRLRVGRGARGRRGAPGAGRRTGRRHPGDAAPAHPRRGERGHRPRHRADAAGCGATRGGGRAMNRPALLRRAANLRVRMLLFMLAGLLFAGASFEVLLVTLTRRRLMEETGERTRALAGQLAERQATPLVLGDTLGMASELARIAAE